MIDIQNLDGIPTANDFIFRMGNDGDPAGPGWKRKIVMPAHLLRESGGGIGTAFENFATCAQRLGVYTSQDYIDILTKLNTYWDLGSLRALSDEAERARDYLMNLPERLEKLAGRMKLPEDNFRFKWVEANGVM